jgi:hypothetical protein
MPTDPQVRADAIEALTQLIMSDGQPEDDAREAATKIIDWRLGGGTSGPLPSSQPE